MADTVSGASEVCALLADGTTVRLRPACPKDRAQVLRLYDDMSADSLRSRFVLRRQRPMRAASPPRH
ncbi:hypothetical protein Scani_38330 [Streptomyces caniferus]|uniref:Uncharacterized protein n=1 Tax=Streptomyces caniferus TaxID=285557 RepID=A0A640SDA7_9ACTN|nr:hypothetical protein Scani_38330 [Streptomyces caniferus]